MTKSSVRCSGLLTMLLLLLAAEPPAEAPVKQKGLADLQGTWQLASVESDDETAEGNVTGLPKWVIQGDKVMYGGEELAVLTLDPSTTPKTIDLAFLKPKRVLEGVYSVEKDTWKVCVNRQTSGVKERPLDFSTKDHPERRLLTFQRAKAGSAMEGVASFIGIAVRVEPDGKGVSVGSVVEGSPAEKAELKKDDTLLKIGEGLATDLKGTIGLVRQARPGSQLTIRVQRGGKEQEITVRVGVVPFYLLD